MPPIDLALSLLSCAHPPDRAQQIYTEKIKQRPLHLKPTEGVGAANAQQARRATRVHKLDRKRKAQKPKPLSSRQKHALCLYDIPKEAQKYAIYEPLNKLWIGYIQEILSLSPSSELPSNHQAQQKAKAQAQGKASWEGERKLVTASSAAVLSSADFHGAEVEVVRSRCVSRVGVQGIIVKDSMHVFELITKKDEVKVIPKEGTVFRFWVPIPGKEAELKDKKEKADGQRENGEVEEKKGKELVFELHGDQFIFRAADRANKKFKPHFLKDV